MSFYDPKIRRRFKGRPSATSTRKVRDIEVGTDFMASNRHNEFQSDLVYVRANTAGDRAEEVYFTFDEFEKMVAELQAMIDSPEYQGLKYKMSVRSTT